MRPKKENTMIQEKIKQLKQMIIAQANDVENMLAHFKKGL